MKVTLKNITVESRHFHHTIVTWVQVPPEIAFDYVADITRHHEWALDKIIITPRTPGPVQLGSKYTVVGRQGGKDWPSEVEVTGYEPSQRFEFTATGGQLAHQRAIRIGMSSCLLPKTEELILKFDGLTRQRQTGHHRCFTCLRF